MTLLEPLAEDYLDWLFAENPVLASHHGAAGDDGALGDLSADGVARREAAEDAFAERFASVPDDDLDATGRVDRDLVLSWLRGSAIDRGFERWRRDPADYVGAGLFGVFALFNRRLHPEADLVGAAVSRLGEVARVLDEGRANLDPSLASPLLVRRALGMCRSAVAYCRDLVPSEAATTEGRARLGTAGAAAAEQYTAFAAFLEDLAGRARGDHFVGEARYSALLAQRELLGDDAASLRARGAAAHAALVADVDELCARHFGGRPWRDVLDEVNADCPRTPEEMRDGYEAATAAARAFLVEHGLVSFPEGERCAVEPAPPFHRPILAVASYIGPPAMRSTLAGRFNVPYPPEGTPEHEVAQRLADNSYPSMATTSVHEAYPGHHWHFATLNSRSQPIRRLVSSVFFVEGWALYAERMMWEEGFFTTPAQELCHAEARMFRAARIVVDTSLHCGDMTFDAAVAFMQANSGLTEATARQEVIRYCAGPVQASSYLTGALEIERIRDRWTAEVGGGLRRFHDELAASGSLPLGLAERALLGS
ncbi:MAG: DUF885 domain-containing protein [Acidimicrobiia bacterium]